LANACTAMHHAMLAIHVVKPPILIEAGALRNAY